MGGDPVLDIGDKRHQRGQSQDPSCAFLRLVSFLRLTISQTGVDLLNNQSRDRLAQYNGLFRSLDWNRRVNDLKLTGSGTRAGERTGSHLDLPNAGDVTRPGQTPSSKRDTSGVGTGYTNKDDSEKTPGGYEHRAYSHDPS